MNMIEKVARAIHKSERSTSDIKFFLPIAKAAVEVMKEPTEEMLNVVKFDYGAKGIYNDMIEAALKE